ncbi:PREDICTED: uncharacterized protein LOC109466637 [Branchiostoma belcheri]|uniref:Uncharacterized protein LOC109466637 n=1 Tax=Branchiostoma belcheri TaxID=7741 RepID=A0A6P4YRS4_BRABE|nr:PREDICTED: uncharacterized protein LOC109466637 [Branchiostoma belcheri]
MTTTCGAYHLEALRRQQVIDRKQLALQRLAQKEFGMSWDNPFNPDLRPDVLLQDGQPWSPDMTECPKPFSPDMGRPTTADMMPQGGPMDGQGGPMDAGPPAFGPPGSGGGCNSPSELVQPDSGIHCDPGAPRFIDVPKSGRIGGGSRLGTPPSRAGTAAPFSPRVESGTGSAVPFSPVMEDGEMGGRADSQMSGMSEPVVPPDLQQAARAAGAAEEQARSAEHAARLERQRRERIEAKHRAQQEHLAALSGGEKRKSHKKDRRTDHLTRQVLSLTPTDQKRLYSVLKEEMSKSAGAKPHAHKNYRTTQDRTAGVHPAVIHDLKKKEKLLRNNNLTMGHWSDYVD